ncbi:MAG: NAD(P)H-binding protein [Rhodospirillales bacterium]|nr:NAD(P)H-binding protein [Rhodospirillales bacterium]
MSDPVHVIGASGRSGGAVLRALAADAIPAIAVVRSPARLNAPALAVRCADLGDGATLTAALADATRIVSCAHARFIPAILAAAPPDARLVLMGSTRRFTRWPDAHGAGVIAGEAAFRAGRHAGVLLHPTMIYGATGEDNVQRLAALLRRLPFVPLPGGGRALVQPIHQDDVTRAILAALDIAWTRPEVLILPGPAPVAYADFVRAVARAAGLPRPRILAVPGALLRAGAMASPLLPFLPRVRGAEIRRLMEDKDFDPAPAIARLGFTPMTLETGLARSRLEDKNLPS